MLTIDWNYHRDFVTVSYDSSTSTVAELVEVVDSLGPYEVEVVQPLACFLQSTTQVVERVIFPTDAPDFFRRDLDAARAAARALLIHFETSWCGACKTMREQVLADQHNRQRLDNGKIAAITIDADEHPSLARAYGVVAIPCFFFFNRRGQLVDRLSNVESADAFLTRLEALTHDKKSTRHPV